MVEPKAIGKTCSSFRPIRRRLLGKQKSTSVMVIKREEMAPMPQRKAPARVKYQLLHSKMFAARRLTWPPVVSELPGQYAHLLTLRSQEILSYDCQVNPIIQGRIRILHLGQSMSRVQTPKEPALFPCIIPHGGHWDRVRGRPVFGAELLQCQGMDVSMMKACRQFSDDIMTDMAGNAFSAAAALATVMAAFITVPVWSSYREAMSEQECLALSPAALINLTAPGEVQSDGESDIEEENVYA